MNSRERLLTALDHREPDRVPFDLGSTQVTGIHVVAYRRLRQHLGLPPVEPVICDEIQGLALPDDDGVERLGVDVRGLFPLNSHNDRVNEKIRREPKDGGEEVEAFVDEWGITSTGPIPTAFTSRQFATPWQAPSRWMTWRSIPGRTRARPTALPDSTISLQRTGPRAAR